MLVLMRRPHEVVRIGDEITITVLGIKGYQVRIGIDAPKSVGVHREEIYQQIQRGENRLRHMNRDRDENPNSG